MPKNEITDDVKERSKLTKEEWKEYTKTVWSIGNVSHERHPAVFPREIPHRLIKMFTFIGETVLDPFAGVGTTAKEALDLGRNTVCIDQNPEYVEIMHSSLDSFQPSLFEDLNHDVSFDVRQGDARDLSFLDDESVHLTVTSPPYWDKADYGSREDNLGNVHNYQQFFKEIRPAFEEWYRVLAPGRKACIVTANVNQHTNHGLLTFPLATDFTNLMRDIGFVMITEIIWSKDRTGGKWGSYGTQRPIFGSYPYPPNFLFKNVHEYILVFAKPGGSQRNGKKVKNYEELMSRSDD